MTSPTAAQPAGSPDLPVGLGVPSEPIGGAREAIGDDAYQALVRRLGRDVDTLAARPGSRPLPPAGPRLLVALDVDGTLLDMDGTVSPRVLAAVSALVDAGAHVVVSTGRGVQAAVPVIRHLGLTHGWAVCANGAITLRLDPALPGGHEVTEQVTFDPAHAIDTLLEALPEGIVAVEVPGNLFRSSRPFPDGELIEECEVVSVEELRASPATRVILRAPGMPVDEFTALVAGSGLHSVEYSVGWTAWLDVAPEGVTKASALHSLASRLGLDASCAVAVGDGANDVEMIEWAGCGVVMGSAPEAVAQRGDVRTEPVWRDGAAALLDALLRRDGGEA